MATQKQSEYSKNLEMLISKPCEENATANHKLIEQIECAKDQIVDCGSKLQENMLKKYEAHVERLETNDGKNPQPLQMW